MEINAEKTKYLFLSREHNVGQNRNKSPAKEFFENVAKFKYLKIKLTNQNCVSEEVKRRKNSGNVCNHFVHNLLSFH